MDTIGAIHLVGYGDPAQGLVLTREPDPRQPGEGEVLVRVDYAPINLNDLMVVLGIYPWKPNLPSAFGNEGTGTVLAVGTGVEASSGLRPGVRVVLPFMARTWRQRLLAPASELVTLPDDADPHQAAMLAINGVTASLLLDEVVLEPGDAIVFNAATSGLARWLAELSTRRGLTAIGLVRRAEDVAPLAEAVPGLLVAFEGEDAATIRDRAGARTVRLALDGVGGAAASKLIRLLSDGSMFVSYGAASRKPMEIPSSELIFRDIVVRGFWEGTPRNTARVLPTLRELVSLIGPGGVRQPVSGVYPMHRVADAIAHASRGGKVLLAMNPNPTLEGLQA